MYSPIAGSIASRITSLTTSVIQDLTRRDKYKIEDYIDLLETDPVARACCELKALRATISLGEYANENKEHQKFITENFETMTDNLPAIVGRLCSAMPLGFSVAEIIYDTSFNNSRGKWKLKGFNVLDPKRVTFQGFNGNITHVRYADGTKDVHIPYSKVIHITNGLCTTFDSTVAYGSAEMRRALPYIKLKQVVMAELAVSCKTMGTGVLVALADSSDTVQMYDAYNKPMVDLQGNPITINAVASLAKQLEGLENHSHIVTDKKNTITALQIPSGDQLFNIALQIMNTQIMRAFGCPELLFSEGSGALGVATLSSKQLTLLDGTIEAITGQIRDQLIERVCKPLLCWNFGHQKNYGSFSVKNSSDPAQESMLLQSLMSAMSMSLLPSNDPDCVNKLRELLKLPAISAEQLEYQQQMQTMMQAQQNQQIGQPPDPSTAYP